MNKTKLYLLSQNIKLIGALLEKNYIRTVINNFSMSSIHYLKKKIQHTYLIWLQKSNHYIQLEEPAWFVFKRIVKRYKNETIANECVERYGITKEEGLNFVNEIRSGITAMNESEASSCLLDKYSEEINAHQFKPYSIRHYRLGDYQIKFSFENPLFEQYIHPLISHLENDEEPDDIPLFELFGYKKEIVFRVNGNVKGKWTDDETHLVKGMIFMNIVNVMFDKTENDWLMTVHASAITNGRKTILISAAPGSGKTTMAALLQQQGYRIISDDFVPIDRSSFAFPFPIAMSIKQGSVDLLSTIFPTLEEKPVTQITPEKSVRFLAPEINHEFYKQVYPVSEFIFIQYNDNVDFELITPDRIQAIKQLLDQSWVSYANGTATILFDLLSQWSFYQLTYSNNQKALDAITKLFDHDQ